MKKRQIVIEGDIAYVPLTRGYVATIDASDVALVDGFDWSAVVYPHTVYAVRGEMFEGKRQTIYMHRFLMKPLDSQFVDHKDHDGLNNRRCNIRVCDKYQSQWNTRKKSNNTSGFKGVSWHKAANKWHARIRVNGERLNLGLFDSPEEAHIAYIEASRKYHNEFGHTG